MAKAKASRSGENVRSFGSALFKLNCNKKKRYRHGVIFQNEHKPHYIQQKCIISMHSLKQSLCHVLVQATAPRLMKHPVLKVHGLLFLLFYSDIFYDADAMTRSMTCDQSSSHKDAHALNTTMQHQASSQWSTEGLQNQSQRSGVMSLDTVLSQQNKANAIFMWPFMWAMQKYWWPRVEISSVVKTECCQQLSTFTKAHEASKNIPK